MKKTAASIVLVGLFAVPAPATVWINELHYDNAGGDVGEFVEIVVSNDEVAALADISITLYNGNGGATYNSTTLAGANIMLGDTVDGHTIYWWQLPANGLQNGSPDGLSLDIAGSVIEFLSYEGAGGSMTATAGVASGMSSMNIGVFETSTTPIGSSLGLSGNLGSYAWTVFDVAATPGSINVGQSFLVPTPGALALLGLAGFAARRRRRQA